MIQDRQDPSGQGMFSKSGRQSGNARTMLERVISSQTTRNKKQGSFLANQMNPYSNIFEEIIVGQNENFSQRPNSANHYSDNQKNYFQEYSSNVKEKAQFAQSIEPFSKQITRDQYNKSYTQKQNGANQNKVKIISEIPDPHRKKARLVWDILKVYRNQQKSRQNSQINLKDEDINITQTSVLLTQPKEQTRQDSSILLKYKIDPSTKGIRNTQTTPNKQRIQSQEFNGQYIDTQKSQDELQKSASKSPNKERNLQIDVMPQYPERVKPKVVGFTDFKRQLNRSIDSYDKFYKVNEKRFENLKDSPVSTKSRHQRDYSFNKQLNREAVSCFKPDEKIPDNGYKPNFEVTKRSLGRVGPCFSKISPHKSLEKKLVGVFQGVHYEYDTWVKNRNRNSTVYKNNRLNLIPFDRQLSREQNPNHVLPGYMQSVRSRISLQDLSQKMLEENSYMDQKYINMNSINSTKTSMSRQSTKSFTQQNFFRSASLMRTPSNRERVKTVNSNMHYNGRVNQRTQNSQQNNNNSGQITNNQFYY